MGLGQKSCILVATNLNTTEVYKEKSKYHPTSSWTDSTFQRYSIYPPVSKWDSKIGFMMEDLQSSSLKVFWESKGKRGCTYNSFTMSSATFNERGRINIVNTVSIMY